MSANIIIVEKVPIPFDVAWRNGMPYLKYVPEQGLINSTTMLDKERGLVIAKIPINQCSRMVDMVIGKVDNVGYGRCRLPYIGLLPELIVLDQEDVEYAKNLAIRIYPSCIAPWVKMNSTPTTSIKPEEAAATTSNPEKVAATTSDVEQYDEPHKMSLKSYETSISSVAYIMYYSLILRSLTSRGCTMGYYLKHVAKELDRSYQWYNEYVQVSDHTALNPGDVTSTLTSDKSAANAWNVLTLILDHHSKLYHGESCHTHLSLASKAINMYLDTHQ